MNRAAIYTGLANLFIILGIFGVITVMGADPSATSVNSEREAGQVIGFAAMPLVLFAMAGAFMWQARRVKRRDRD